MSLMPNHVVTSGWTSNGLSDSDYTLHRSIMQKEATDFHLHGHNGKSEIRRVEVVISQARINMLFGFR